MPRATEKKPGVSTAAGPGAVDAPVSPAAETLGGEDFRRLLQSATTWLERNAAAVDALNVFPVPDGDTGTNMLLTMRATLDGARKVKGSAAGAVLKGAAQGAVMGARGNSGVILSQIIAGIARGAGEHETCDGSLLAAALAEGAATAYRAVSRPVEGTILTVARLAGDGAVAAAGQPPAGVPLTCRYVMERAHSAAREAVERTPEQLPVLRQSGVVDAGGEGYRVILEGMALDLAGESLPESPSTTPHTGEGARAEGSVPLVLDAQDGGEWGYCTQFLIHGDALDVMRLRETSRRSPSRPWWWATSLFVRVHGHTENPGELLTFAVRYGRLQRISIEDMDAQHDAWLRNQVQTTESPAEAKARPHPPPPHRPPGDGRRGPRLRPGGRPAQPGRPGDRPRRADDEPQRRGAAGGGPAQRGGDGDPAPQQRQRGQHRRARHRRGPGRLAPRPGRPHPHGPAGHRRPAGLRSPVPPRRRTSPP